MMLKITMKRFLTTLGVSTEDTETNSQDYVTSMSDSQKKDSEKRNSWLSEGIKNGYISTPYCYTHDLIPTSIQEDEDAEGYDNCIPVARLYDSPEIFKEVVESNTPERSNREYWLNG